MSKLNIIGKALGIIGVELIITAILLMIYPIDKVITILVVLGISCICIGIMQYFFERLNDDIFITLTCMR